MIDLFLHLPEKHGFHLTIYEDIHHPAKNKKIGDIKVCSIFETLYEQKSIYIKVSFLRSVVGLVIQATGRMEFEDGLRTGVLLGSCWCPCSGRTYPRINFKPLWGCGLVLGWVWLLEGPHFRPNSAARHTHP